MRPDVVVIGAGIVGACTALELTRAGLRVTVVEKTGVGHGSTAASSACIRQGYGTREAVLLSRDSLRAWEQWREYAEAGGGREAARFVRTGVLYLVADAATLEAEAGLMRDCGVEAEVLRVDEIRRRWPDWDATGVAGGIVEAEGGYVDQPDLAARNAMDAALARGAELRIDRVVGVGPGEVRLERGGAVACGAIVNAAGPWAFQINRLAGVAMPLRPVRHRTILAPAGPTSDLPVVGDLAGGTYFRPDPSQGGLLVGSLDDARDGQPCGDPDACDPTVDRAFFESTCAAVARRMPERVLFPPWTRGLAGLYDVHEPDWYPVFDRTEVDGYFVAAGTSGAWFKGGPSIGALMTHLVLGRSGFFALPRARQEIDPRFFRRDRPPIRSVFAGGVVG